MDYARLTAAQRWYIRSCTHRDHWRTNENQIGTLYPILILLYTIEDHTVDMIYLLIIDPEY